MKQIKVKDIVGNYCNPEDGIVVRQVIESCLDDQIVLDFEDIEKVPTTFLCTLFTNLINKLGREYIFSKINVKNLSNIRNYKRVVLGTTF
ncbi:STAS-like domain-containing protein [Haloimpatiens sp. FM7330]|uniref:STAS-like domain-containing protein n=1 Tax=Haloimpatiens sp. FM7330 TaxID=3298610 RepID=UPI003634B2CE